MTSAYFYVALPLSQSSQHLKYLKLPCSSEEQEIIGGVLLLQRVIQRKTNLHGNPHIVLSKFKIIPLLRQSGVVTYWVALDPASERFGIRYQEYHFI